MFSTNATFESFLSLTEERSSAFLTPSRERKRIVDNKSSNWMAAVPKVRGVARRRSAWFSAKVKALEKSWRRTREEAFASELCPSFSLITNSDRSGKEGSVAFPDTTSDQAMFEKMENPVIESSLWAYEVSPSLSPPPSVKKTDAYILLGKGNRRRQARRGLPQESR